MKAPSSDCTNSCNNSASFVAGVPLSMAESRHKSIMGSFRFQVPLNILKFLKFE